MNKVILMGRAGADPEIKSGTGSFSLATSFKKSNGEEVTEWHRIKVFGKTAEIADRYIRKGARVLIEGRIQTQKWKDKYYTDIIVDRLEIVDFPPKAEVDEMIEQIVNEPSLQPDVLDDPLTDIPF